MFGLNLNKKSGFTLAEIMVTLGLIGAISALTIPTLAYNYRSKVLEEQFRSTYSDIKQIGAMLNYQKGDVGEFALNSNFFTWQSEFISMLNGGNNMLSTPGHANITNELRRIYREGGGSPGPYTFNLDGGKLRPTGIHCDNGAIWNDSKGRLWTFNSENRIICVDINGSGNPNRFNIDIFAFIPMNAQQVAAYVYNDQDNANNYSGAIVLCDIDKIHRKGLSNNIPERDENKKYNPSKDNPKTALDTCPFNYPIENIAPTNGVEAGKSAKGKNVTNSDTYWKKYIEYK